MIVSGTKPATGSARWVAVSSLLCLTTLLVVLALSVFTLRQFMRRSEVQQRELLRMVEASSRPEVAEKARQAMDRFRKERMARSRQSILFLTAAGLVAVVASAMAVLLVHRRLRAQALSESPMPGHAPYLEETARELDRLAERIRRMGRDASC